MPLPDEEARLGLVKRLMRKQGSGGGGLVEDPEKLQAIVRMTAGYSGSDLSAVREAYCDKDRDWDQFIVPYLVLL